MNTPTPSSDIPREDYLGRKTYFFYTTTTSATVTFLIFSSPKDPTQNTSPSTNPVGISDALKDIYVKLAGLTIIKNVIDMTKKNYTKEHVLNDDLFLNYGEIELEEK